MDQKKGINLYALKQPAIIVKADTGLVYSNQTDGVACSHPHQEGFLVILRPVEKERIFDPNMWYKDAPALDDKLYDEIERVLNGAYRFDWHVSDIRVDREASNCEAWVHVRFRGDFTDTGMTSGGFSPNENGEPDPANYPEYEGILTWENCD